MVKQFDIVAYVISRHHTLSHVFPIGFLSKGDNEPKTKLRPFVYKSPDKFKCLIVNEKRRKPFCDFLLHSAESEAPLAEGEG